jgi:MFS transporter, DHA1 family, multidrug resistance protein
VQLGAQEVARDAPVRPAGSGVSNRSTSGSSVADAVVGADTTPEARRARWLVGGTVLLVSIAAFFRVPLLPSIGAELDMTAAQLGLITTVFAVGRLATDIPAGRRADRGHPLRSLGVAGAILAAGSLVMATATAGVVVIASAALLGVASALSNTTGMTYFTASAPRHRRGTSVAAFSAALLGGQALGPAIGGAIAGASDWRVAVGAAAVVGSVLAVFGIGLGPRLFAIPFRHDRRSTAGPRPAPAAERRSRGRDHRQQTWLLNLVPFASMYTLGAMPQTLVPIIGDDRFGLSASVIGIALGLGGVCRFVGAIVGGRIADRVSRKASLVPGMALGAVGVAVLALPLGTAGWVAAIVLMSLGSNAVSVAAAMLGDRAPAGGVGRHLGPYRFVGDLGLIAGPVVTTLLYSRVNATVSVLSVAALMAAVALLSALALHETRWADHDHPMSTHTAR